MVEGEQVRSWGARLVAPVVFFAAVTLLVLLIQSSLEDDEESSPALTLAATTGSSETNSGATGQTETGSAQRQFYRVRSGDTLESISARFDTTVADLLALNPNIDPLALTPRQRIRVR